MRDKLIWPFLVFLFTFDAFAILHCYSHANKAHCCCWDRLWPETFGHAGRNPGLMQVYFLLYFDFSVTRKSEAIVHLVKEQSTLQGHLILSIQTDNELLCAMKCLNTANCFSFNYKRYNNVCELNHTNKLTSPNDLTRDLHSVYYEMVFS